MSDLPDVQGERAQIPVALDMVGVSGLVKKVKVVRDGKEMTLIPEFSAYINLPREQRGVHMSRSSETIESIVEDVAYKPVEGVEELCRKLLERLLEKHEYSDRAVVVFESPLVLDVRAGEEEVKRQKACRLHVRGEAKRGEEVEARVFVGVSVDGMTACPCAQEMVRSYAEAILAKRAEELSLSKEVIGKILDVVPLASHSQRCRGTLIVEVGNGGIDLTDLVEVVESSMSGSIQDVLKRHEEARLVRLAHLNPLFVEDVARLIIFNTLRRLKWLPDESVVEVRVESMESVHSYNTVAYRKATVKELKRELASSGD